jgi:hypothetical protein
VPKNRLIYYGVLIVVASALIWIGAWLTKHIEWILPYTGAAGIVLMIIGLALEIRGRSAPPSPEEP